MGWITLCDHDPSWSAGYRRAAASLSAVLGARIIRIEHVGSTAVPELPAKPIIDIVLEVPDSSDEQTYVAPLAAIGYVLRIREPEWFEHRLLTGDRGRINLHVFGAGCPETERMVRFRDWLATHSADRGLYAQVKRDLAAREWRSVQDYADAKTEVVSAIIGRALDA